MKNFGLKLPNWLLWSSEQRQYPFLAWIWVIVPIIVLLEILNTSGFDFLFVIGTLVTIAATVGMDAIYDVAERKK